VSTDSKRNQFNLSKSSFDVMSQSNLTESLLNENAEYDSDLLKKSSFDESVQSGLDESFIDEHNPLSSFFNVIYLDQLANIPFVLLFIAALLRDNLSLNFQVLNGIDMGLISVLALIFLTALILTSYTYQQYRKVDNASKEIPKETQEQVQEILLKKSISLFFAFSGMCIFFTATLSKNILFNYIAFSCFVVSLPLLLLFLASKKNLTCANVALFMMQIIGLFALCNSNVLTDLSTKINVDANVMVGLLLGIGIIGMVTVAAKYQRTYVSNGCIKTPSKADIVKSLIGLLIGSIGGYFIADSIFAHHLSIAIGCAVLFGFIGGALGKDIVPSCCSNEDEPPCIHTIENIQKFWSHKSLIVGIVGCILIGYYGIYKGTQTDFPHAFKSPGAIVGMTLIGIIILCKVLKFFSNCSCIPKSSADDDTDQIGHINVIRG
jgi:hypothetical protein